MLNPTAIASDSNSYSSTTSSELVRHLTCKFEQELRKVVAAIGSEKFTPTRFNSAFGDLRAMLAGSRNVESAAKNIVQARLKRNGMRWSRDGGQHVLDLRTYLKSGR